MSCREIRIDSWSKYVDFVSREPYCNCAFRGHAEEQWHLEPTVRRILIRANVHPSLWCRQEERTLRIFQRTASHYLQHLPADKDGFEWLAIMQHYGSPTRLLDFTWSPYVAAFFALEHATGNCAVWAFNAHELLIQTQHGDEESQPHPTKLWEEGAYREYFLGTKKAFIWYGEPFNMNDRLIAQAGTFVVPSLLNVSVDTLISNEYRRPSKILYKFVFNTQSMRQEAMGSLHSMNIKRSTLFPGLDGLAQSMEYELEFNSWVDTQTGELKSTLK